MGNYERTYNAIHKYKMGKLFWQAKMKDLEGEYIRVVRAMCEWEWNNRKGVLVLSLGGNEYNTNTKNLKIISTRWYLNVKLVLVNVKIIFVNFNI